MKLAISSQGTGKDSHVDLRFGRARYFVIFNTKTEHVAAFSNERNLDADQWAGIEAGRNVIKSGVDAVITGHTGPKAFATLQSGGVKVFTGEDGTVAHVIEQFMAGKLKLAENVNVEEHLV